MHYLTKATLLVSLVLILPACATTVHPGERGVRGNLLTGDLTQETLKSGSYWQMPWSRISVYNVQWRSYTETVEALSSDDLPVNIKTVILMRPAPDEVSILAQNMGSDFYDRAVKPALLTAVRSAVSGYPMVTVLEHGHEIVSKAEAVVAEKLRSRHLQVASVAMVDIELARLELNTHEHMQANKQEFRQKDLEFLAAEKAVRGFVTAP